MRGCQCGGSASSTAKEALVCDGVVVVVVMVEMDLSQSSAKQKHCTRMLMYARYMPEQANPSHLVMPLG